MQQHQKQPQSPPQISGSNDKQYFSFVDAADLISNKLSLASAGAVFHFPKSFFEFVRDIWSQSYEKPEWFREWYVELLCTEAQEAIESGKNYVAQLPRGHLKSTILGYAFAVWYLGCLENTDNELLYLSYTDGMSTYHIGKIKDAVNSNPVLNKHMTDLAGTAISVFRFSVNGHIKRIIDGGIFKFKRGIHTSGMIADDLLKDPSSPLNLTQLEKVEQHFTSESMLIPNPGTPTIVFGTPMAPDDLLAKLSANVTFKSRILPALNPTPDHDVLAPKIRSKEWLLNYQQQHPNAFRAEFALVPFLSTQSYLVEEDVKACMKNLLEKFNPNRRYKKQPGEFIFAGVDVGKKRHPTHIAIYSAIENANNSEIEIRQIFQEFLDGWEYTEQKNYLNQLAENFLIDAGYIDNTNSVLEERGLNKPWQLITLSKSKNNNMAQIFEEHIHSGHFSMLDDERQLSQIICVDINLNAPDTINGHGDSFFSNALALLAFEQNYRNSTALVGDVQDLVTGKNQQIRNGVLSMSKGTSANVIVCQKCGESGGMTESGRCLFCYTKLLAMDDLILKQ